MPTTIRVNGREVSNPDQLVTFVEACRFARVDPNQIDRVEFFMRDETTGVRGSFGPGHAVYVDPGDTIDISVFGGPR